MQNYASEELFCVLTPSQEVLYSELQALEEKLHFPAVKPDVGQFLSFLTKLHRPERIFEFGSGYGHSAFWYLLAETQNLKSIVLTEKRDDLEAIFQKLPWPSLWKEKLFYHQGDAFECLEAQSDKYDLVLVDGTKAQYQSFTETIYKHLADKALVVIDNGFCRGDFLDPSKLHKNSPKAIKDLHQWLKFQELYDVTFIPMSDGIFLLRKKL